MMITACILAGKTWPGCPIVGEQGSNKDLADWLGYVQRRGIRVKPVLSNQRGGCVDIHRGLEPADARFVAITDDACFAGEGRLTIRANKLRLSHEALVIGRVESAGEDVLLVVTLTIPSVQNRPRIKFDCMSGGNMETTIDRFQNVGLFEKNPVVPLSSMPSGRTVH